MLFGGKMKEKEDTFFTIDNSLFLRGIGTILVVLAHYAQWYISMGNQNIFWLLLSKTGRYGVAIFFFVSGYGIVCSARNGLDIKWIGRRIINVYLPYLCIQGFIHVLSRTEWTLRRMLRYIFGLDAWFVFVILLFYILFFIVWKYGKRKMLWMIVGIAGISLVLALAMKDSVWYASNIAFLIGVAVAQCNQEFLLWVGRKKPVFCGFMLILFLICGIFYSYFMNRLQPLYLLGKIMASAVWVTFVISLFPMRIEGMRCVKKIGKSSLEIYLIHGFIIQELSTIFPQTETIIVLIMSLVLAFLVGQCVHYLSKRLFFSRRI